MFDEKMKRGDEMQRSLVGREMSRRDRRIQSWTDKHCVINLPLPSWREQHCLIKLTLPSGPDQH